MKLTDSVENVVSSMVIQTHVIVMCPNSNECDVRAPRVRLLPAGWLPSVTGPLNQQPLNSRDSYWQSLLPVATRGCQGQRVIRRAPIQYSSVNFLWRKSNMSSAGGSSGPVTTNRYMISSVRAKPFNRMTYCKLYSLKMTIIYLYQYNALWAMNELAQERCRRVSCMCYVG